LRDDWLIGAKVSRLKVAVNTRGCNEAKSIFSSRNHPGP
jgi:hypothetical protein